MRIKVCEMRYQRQEEARRERRVQQQFVLMLQTLRHRDGEKGGKGQT